MELDKSKRELKLQIEAARRAFLASGRKTMYLQAEPDEEDRPAKPRKQRLKMFA